MKAVNRSSIVMPKELADVGSPAATERSKVKHHYANPDAKAYKFSAYKQKEVITAINALFKNKCAYCESRYSATSPTDVEHFRPKARVSDEAGHRGYWWLASTWTNLLASCIFCNRAHNNDLYDWVVADWLPRQVKSGKHDNFPLAFGVRAFSDSDDLTAEDPLLIDPTQRDPAEYVSWRKVEGVQVIVPLEADGATTPYAAESIRVYGLNRRQLVEARTGTAQAIEVEAGIIADDIRYAAGLDRAMLAAFMPRLEARVLAFKGRVSPDTQYAGMVEYLVNFEMNLLIESLERLREKCK